MIRVKRVYERAAAADGVRFLVDQLWPRGLGKQEVKVNRWLKEVAPSKELRRWFGHEPAKWAEFQRRYAEELDGRPDAWEPLRQAAEQGDITLVFGARDTEHNNAVALKKYLDKGSARKRRRPVRSQAKKRAPQKPRRVKREQALSIV